MTATLLLFVTLLAILIGAVWIVRIELRKPDPLDYCDPAATEPMPIEHVSAKNYWEKA